jgi:long-chain acyl-CoA synthetase
MQKVWLQEYPQGISAEANVDAYSSLDDIFEQSCQRFASRPAYRNMGATITYRRLDELSRAFGAYLQKAAGLTKGDRVAVMMPNLLQYPVVLFGALRAGFTVVNCNPLYTARELEHQLQDSGAVAIVVLENFARTLQRVIARTGVRTVITTEVGDLFSPLKGAITNWVVRYVKRMVPRWRIQNTIPLKQVLRRGRALTLDNAALGRDDIAFLQYTGGTTGVSKGAILSHGNLVANLQQLSAWIAGDLTEGAEVAVLPLPLYHVYALTTNLMFMKIGAQTVLITNPRDVAKLVRELKSLPFTIIVGVNTLYNALLNSPEFASIRLRSLKLACAGGMAVNKTVAERWKEATSVPLVEGYGLTETSPVAISNALNIRDWTGTIGLPIPSTDAAIIDEEGRELPPGEVGEIAIRGPQVMKGYWNRPDETANVFTRDGWFRTGDMGFMNPRGYFKITDRKKDMIVVSGFKVFPNEIEDVVMMHPGVLEVAAIGAADEKSGEVVKIVVVRKDSALTREALLAHCNQHLTGYKMPKIVEFRTGLLPKTNIGKILRRQLREPHPI